MPEKSIPWSELYAMQVRLNLTLAIGTRPDGYIVSTTNNGILYSSYLPRPTLKSPASALPVNAAANLVQFETAFITPPQTQVDIANNLTASNIIVDASLVSPSGSEPIDIYFTSISTSKKTVYHYTIPQGKTLIIQRIFGTCSLNNIGVLLSISISNDGVNSDINILTANVSGNLISESLSKEIIGDGTKTIMMEKSNTKRGKSLSTIHFKGYLK